MSEAISTGATIVSGAAWSHGDNGAWHAVYTQSRQEKKVESRLAAKGVETYLPVYVTHRRWNTRRVKLEVPLFPGYLFARVCRADRVKVLQTFGVVDFVRFEGGPAQVADSEIDAVRRCLGAVCTVRPCGYVRVGSRARVLAGPLRGLEGIVRRSKGQTRLVISVDSIQRSMLVEVESEGILVLPNKKAPTCERPAPTAEPAAG